MLKEAIIMARRCFEVSSLIFNFCTSKLQVEANTVFNQVSKHLNKYASNTGIRDHFSFLESGNTVLHIEFQKKISVNTINNILNQIFADTKNVFKIIYDGRYNQMKVIVLE